MPLIDPHHFNRATSLRIKSSDAIVYTLIGDKMPFGIALPELLTLPALGLVPHLPKSGLQLLRPIKYNTDNWVNANQRPVQFGVIFSKDFPERTVWITQRPHLLHVFIWATTNPRALQALNNLPKDKIIIIPGDEKFNDIIRTAPHRVAFTYPELVSEIEERVAFIVKTSMKLMRRRRIIRRALLREFCSAHYKPPFLPFSPLKVNLGQLRQIFGAFDENCWDEADNDRTNRAIELVRSCNAVGKAIAISYASAGIKPSKPSPPIILSFPTINPLLREKLWGKLPEAPAKLRHHFRTVLSARFSEQDSNYLNFVSAKHQDASELMRFGMTQLAQQGRFMDFVGYLHSSFESNAYIRAPIKGPSLAFRHAQFSPKNFPRAAPAASIKKIVKRFGLDISKALHPSIRELIKEHRGGIVALSDLPLEWMDLEGVPLSFLKDVSRMPEAVLPNLLSQFAHNSEFAFRITEKTPSKTLVICGAPPSDPLYKGYITLRDLRKPDATWRIAHCLSLADLYKTINEFRPEILIIDSHGRFNNNDTGTEIQFGDEYLNGNDVIQHLPQIPIVILSTCWGAPLYGCPNTIAHAFFETGSFSVTASMLPLDISKALTLNARLLNNLQYACKEAMHSTWASFMSHCIRTSYLTDIFNRLKSRYSMTSTNQESFLNEATKWKVQTMQPDLRRAAFLEAPKIVVKCYPQEMREKINSILSNDDYLPEFMFYSTLGRADLILFDSWLKKNASGSESMPIIEDMLPEQESKLSRPSPKAQADTG